MSRIGVPAPNFNWPMFDGKLHPVSLVMARDHRNDQLHVQAWTDQDGFPEPWGTVSVVPHDGQTVFLAGAPDEFFCKTYSENRGVLEQLVAQGLVEPTGDAVQPCGSFVSFPRVRLTAKGKALAPQLFPATG